MIKRLFTSLARSNWGHRVAPDVEQRIRLSVERDRRGLPSVDPGSQQAIAAAVSWLCRAQDCSASADGGVARAYSLRSGWSASYPETTGYIIPTIIDCATASNNEELRARARRMLSWLRSIQMPCGGFQGGKIDSVPIVPVVFNTGQILIGLAAGEKAFGGHRDPLLRAADWLVSIQDRDGCWRKFPSPFAMQGDRTYDTHTAWGLLEAARIEPARGYAEAALRNVRWALGHQHNNGWMDKCCLSDWTQPLTHTLGYALRGMLEAFRYSQDEQFLIAAQKTADGLMAARGADGFLPGTLRQDWSSAAEWACLTGTVQIAYCWFTLYQIRGDVRYREAALAANHYVRRTISLSEQPDIRGGVQGSFPIDGDYGKYEYPNWAAKFLIDSLMLECAVLDQTAFAKPRP